VTNTLRVSDTVRGVFLTAREDVLAVLFAGDRPGFEAWARTLEPATTATNRKEALS